LDSNLVDEVLPRHVSVLVFLDSIKGQHVNRKGFHELFTQASLALQVTGLAVQKERQVGLGLI